MNYSKTIMVGRITRDPEMRYSQSGMAICKFGLASTGRKDKSGNAKTCFIDCTAFGKAAELVSEHSGKGHEILVEGRIEYDQWESEDGTKRSKHSIVVDNFQFGARPKGAEQETPDGVDDPLPF